MFPWLIVVRSMLCWTVFVFKYFLVTVVISNHCIVYFYFCNALLSGLGLGLGFPNLGSVKSNLI